MLRQTCGMTSLGRIKKGNRYKKKFRSNGHRQENKRSKDGNGLDIIGNKK